MSKRILVTGGNGQLGMEFRGLADARLHIVSREELDICDHLAVSQVLKSGDYEFVVNCAAYTAVDKAEEEVEMCKKVNVASIQNLAELCALHEVRLIHISSDYVYHPGHSSPISEEDSCNPRGVYARSKFLGEEELRAVLPEDSVVLRTSWVYSSYGHNFVKTMLRLGKERSELNIVDDQIGSPTYARDIAQAIMKIVDGDFVGGVYNFSNLGYISWAEFAEAIFKLAGLEVVVHRIPTTSYPTPSPRPFNSRLIKSRIADVYGVELQHWHKSLVKCLKEIDN